MPESAGIRPSKVRSSVVSPAPLGPKMTRDCPVLSSKVTWSAMVLLSFALAENQPRFSATNPMQSPVALIALLFDLPARSVAPGASFIAPPVGGEAS